HKWRRSLKRQFSRVAHPCGPHRRRVRTLEDVSHEPRHEKEHEQQGKGLPNLRMVLHGFLNTLLFTATPILGAGDTLWLSTRGLLGMPRGRRFFNLCRQQLHTLRPQDLRLLGTARDDPPEHLVE